MSRFHYIIDPGHGALSPGKRSPIKNGRQLFEYEYNQAIAKQLSRLMEAANISHSITIPNPAEFSNDLDYRMGFVHGCKDIAQDVFLISIHGNAGQGDGFGDFTGIEVFYNKQAKEEAQIFQDCIVEASGLADRGIKDGTRLYLLRKAPCPAVLTENGFFNGNDFELMLTKDFRDKIAAAHMRAVLQIECK